MHDLWSTWVVARQDAEGWLFLSDGRRWTRNWHEASLFTSLHGANEARLHGLGSVQLAAVVYQMAVGDIDAVGAAA
ncbi:MAG: hypothetical protein ACYC2H_10180 [Thermoplasmatota archaeon]